MKHIPFLILTMTLFLSQPASADLQLDMLNDKIDRLDREMTILQRKVYQENPTAETDARKKDRASRKKTQEASPETASLDDLYTRIDDQTKVVQELTNKIDHLEQALHQTQEKLALLNADIEQRFKEINKTAPAAESAKPKTSQKTPKEAYDAAYALLKKGEYEKAQKAFSTFLKDYPKSDLAGNANYWLGETYYARGKYEQAIGIFADGVSKYKNSSKAPDNMLKLGLTLKQLNKKTESCTAFKSLETEFPKASQTLKDRAKTEAKKLSCP